MGEIETDKYCLKWNEFETNLTQAFVDLRDKKELFDVTLVCGAKQLEAHRVVLCACSPFFREVISGYPHQHPLLYLRGVKAEDMEGIISFMYKGEVNIAQDQLNAFLLLAKDLKVKGLTQESSNGLKRSQPPDPMREPPQKRSTYHTSSTSTSRVQKAEYSRTDTNSHHVVKQEDVIEVESSSQQMELYPMEAYQEEDYSAYESIAAQDEQIEDYTTATQSLIADSASSSDRRSTSNLQQLLNMQHGGGEINLEEYFCSDSGGYKCSICGHISQDKRLIKIHLEGKHNLSTGYTCDFCHIFLKTQEALRIHKRRKHTDPAPKY